MRAFKSAYWCVQATRCAVHTGATHGYTVNVTCKQAPTAARALQLAGVSTVPYVLCAGTVYAYLCAHANISVTLVPAA